MDDPNQNFPNPQTVSPSQQPEAEKTDSNSSGVYPQSGIISPQNTVGPESPVVDSPVAGQTIITPSTSPTAPQPQVYQQPVVSPNLGGSAYTGVTPPITPGAGTERSKLSSSDKIVGCILGVIGLLGVTGAVLLIMSYYHGTPHSGQVPPFVYLIVPLLFVYSGYYYLSGKNAQRIQSKHDKGIVSRHYQKFGKAETLFTVIIVAIIGYVGWSVVHKTNANGTANSSASAPVSTNKATVDQQIEAVASKIDAAEKQYQKDNQGAVRTSIDKLGVNLTDPATGQPYEFTNYLYTASVPAQPGVIFYDYPATCSPDGSGYMVASSSQNSFAFAMDRETKPPLCYDYQGTLYL
jgi:hypothetical protein